MKALINSMVAFCTHTTSVMRWNLKVSLCYWLAAATLPKTLVHNVINTVLSQFTVAIAVRPWVLNGLKTGLKSHNYCVSMQRLLILVMEHLPKLMRLVYAQAICTTSQVCKITSPSEPVTGLTRRHYIRVWLE